MDKTAKIHISYYLNEEGRRASLLAGGDGKRVQDLYVPATPELLTEAHVKETGEAEISYTHHEFRAIELSQPCNTAAEAAAGYNAAVTAKLQAEADAKAEIAAKVQAEWEASKAHFNAALAAPSQNVSVRRYSENNLQILFSVNIGANNEQIVRVPHTHQAEIDKLNTLANAYQARVKAAEAQAQAARDAVHEAFAAEKRAWIEAHGSERLKKALKLGMLDKLKTVYLEERLAHEIPEAVWDTVASKESDVLNPSVEALTALEEWRVRFPDAYLTRALYESAGKWKTAVTFQPGPWAPDAWAYVLVDEADTNEAATNDSDDDDDGEY